MILSTTLVLLTLGATLEELGANAASSSLAWGDFDADGLLDVYVSDPGGPDRLLRNLGGGTFEPVELPAAGETGSHLARWEDADGDGDLDLFVASAEGGGRLLFNLGDRIFAAASDALPEGLLVGRVRHAAWLDFDGDGAPDLLLEGAEGTALLENDGEGRFTAAEVELGGAITGVELSGLPVAGSPERGPTGETGPGESGRERTAGARSDSADGSSLAGTTTRGETTGGTISADGSPPVTIGNVSPLGFGGPCAKTIEDEGGSGCIGASSIPAAGKLYPLSSNLFVSSATGFVGLGSMNPLVRLHVAGDVFSTGDIQVNESVRLGGGFFTGLQSTTTAELDILAGGANRMHIDDTGRVGVGTTTPGADLEVVGSLEGDEVRAGFGTSTNATYRFGSGGENTGFSSPGVDTIAMVANGAERVRVTADGRVGINDTTPTGMLDIQGTLTGVGGASLRARNASTGSGIAIYGQTSGTDGTMVLTQNGTGSIIRGFNGGGSPVFEVKNSGRCVTSALEITGGGDLVEGFDSGDHEATPGTVMCIDPRQPGKLRTADRAYDSRVAGVVSGANGVNHGIRMGQDDVLDGETLVAMSGRVYVRCTAGNGSIEPGDLLTTSDLAGHAMKATDPERAFGAVIGKAMSPLDAGTGLVLVLVSLQ